MKHSARWWWAGLATLPPPFAHASPCVVRFYFGAWPNTKNIRQASCWTEGRRTCRWEEGRDGRLIQDPSSSTRVTLSILFSQFRGAFLPLLRQRTQGKANLHFHFTVVSSHYRDLAPQDMQMCVYTTLGWMRGRPRMRLMNGKV